jgi:hypothetical protein
MYIHRLVTGIKVCAAETWYTIENLQEPVSADIVLFGFYD